MKKDSISRTVRWALLIVLFVTVIWRLVFVVMNVVPFDADEAIIGLMAKHILEGERPIYFYGQAYMGSIDAYLVALGFLVFGIHVWVIRIVQIIVFMATVLTLFHAGRKLFGNPWIGFIAGTFLAIPPINLTVFTISSLGGYGEMLLFSSVVLWLFATIRGRLSNNNIPVFSHWILFILFGIISGIGIWTHYLVMVISLPCFIFLSMQLYARKELKYTVGMVFLIAVGFIIGLTPIIIFGIKSGWALIIGGFTGKTMAVESIPFGNQLLSHMFNLLFLGIPVLFGLRPPWEAQLLLLPILPIIVGVYILILSKALKNIRLNFQNIQFLMVSIIGLFSVLFIFSPFGVDPTGRYFLPLYIPLAFILGEGLATWCKKKWIAIGLVTILISFNIASTITCAVNNPPGLTVYLDANNRIDHHYDLELIQFLKDQDVTRGYSTYWVSYPIAFLSNEEIIYSPRLPYHQNFDYSPTDVRYPPYDEAVSYSEKIAYITVKFKALDDVLEAGFRSQNVHWDEAIIGDYKIYYNLSDKISLDEVLINK